MRRTLPDLPPVVEHDVAPHKYLYAGDGIERPEGFRAVRTTAPYKAGDVIYVVYGTAFTKAYVHRVWAELDMFGAYRECYDVRRATKVGHFAKNFYRVHPGQVQLGYARAGYEEIPE